ncbi:MAG: hypothetical protein QM831_31585 [Kofleriaceae bacterium]
MLTHVCTLRASPFERIHVEPQISEIRTTSAAEPSYWKNCIPDAGDQLLESIARIGFAFMPFIGFMDFIPFIGFMDFIGFIAPPMALSVKKTQLPRWSRTQPPLNQPRCRPSNA